jgi:hypothetical protein
MKDFCTFCGVCEGCANAKENIFSIHITNHSENETIDIPSLSSVEIHSHQYSLPDLYIVHLVKEGLIQNKFVKKKAPKKYKAKEFIVLCPTILNYVTFIVNEKMCEMSYY